MTTSNKTSSKTQYTPEQTAELIELYNGGEGKTVSELAAHFGKANASIIAKLARLQVYVKPEKPNAKSAGIRKDALADEIGGILQLDESSTDSLTKVNKNALLAIAHALTSLTKDLEEYDEENDEENDDQSAAA